MNNGKWKLVPVKNLDRFSEIIAQKDAEIERLTSENEAWKNGGYTSLWKQRTQDRDVTIELQRQALSELRDTVARQNKRIAELERECGEAVAWFTDDHLCDRSATTYCPDVAERWKQKGWPVTPLYAAPQPAIPEGWVLVPVPTFAFLLEAWDYGQFADDFDQPLAKPVRAAIRTMLAAAQAKIDALMLEYCPDEMTPEQLAEWAKNQRAISDWEQQEIDAMQAKEVRP